MSRYLCKSEAVTGFGRADPNPISPQIGLSGVTNDVEKSFGKSGALHLCVKPLPLERGEDSVAARRCQELNWGWLRFWGYSRDMSRGAFLVSAMPEKMMT